MELISILNSPHQTKTLVIQPEDVNYVLPYKYMFQQRGIRIVTFSAEYIIVTKDEQHA